jgi:hypothetical protein
MTFILDLFYDPTRISRHQYKKGPYLWRRFKDTYLYDYCCVYVYGWLGRHFWVIGGKIADPTSSIRPENDWDKALWPLMACPQYKYFSLLLFFMSGAMLIKNMKR